MSEAPLEGCSYEIVGTCTTIVDCRWRPRAPAGGAVCGRRRARRGVAVRRTVRATAYGTLLAASPSVRALIGQAPVESPWRREFVLRSNDRTRTGCACSPTLLPPTTGSSFRRCTRTRSAPLRLVCATSAVRRARATSRTSSSSAHTRSSRACERRGSQQRLTRRPFVMRHSLERGGAACAALDERGAAALGSSTRHRAWHVKRARRDDARVHHARR